MFQKKIIVAAVVGALGAAATGAAFAQAPRGSENKESAGSSVGNVEIYGFLYPQFAIMKSSGATVGGASSSTLGSTPSATGATLKSRNAVEANNSRIGFRGTEDLGNGLSAVWQVENTVNIDDGASSPLASRDSFVGLKGSFGTVRLGNMETVYKTLGDPLKFLNVSSGNFVSASNILSSRQSFNAAGTASSAGSFHLRRVNSVLYTSPNFGGVQLHAMYSPDEARVGNLNADLQSYGATYKIGGLDLRFAYEIHNDLFAGSLNTPAAIANPTTGAGNVHSKDTSPRASAMYSWGDTSVAVDIATIKFSESNGAAGKFQDYKNTRYNLAWQQNWGGPWRTIVQYTSASAGTCTLVGGTACTTTGLQGNMFSMGGEYWFSKRTALFALYAKLNNGSAATYNNSASVKTLSAGDDITQYALGIRTNF